MEKVILLNADHTFLDFINWKDALTKFYTGKVEILKSSEKCVCNMEKTFKFIIPKIVKLVNLVKTIYSELVPYSKHNVLVRDDYRCQYCGTKGNMITVDHIIPKSRGGKNSFENCVASCKKCNNDKDNRTPKEAGLKLKQNKYHHPTVVEFLRLKLNRNTQMKKLLDELYI